MTHLPRHSTLVRAMAPDAERWGVAEQLAAATVDALRAANWQRSGGRGRRPRPIERPGVGDRARPARLGSRQTRTAEERAAYLDRFAPPRRQRRQRRQ